MISKRAAVDPAAGRGRARRARFGVLALLCALSACAVPGSDRCHLAYIGEVPMWRLNNRLIVPAAINSKPVPLLFDTGGVVSLMSAAHAQELGLKAVPIPAKPGAAPSLAGIGGSRTAGIMRADSVQLGRLLAYQVPFVVPASATPAASGHDPDTLGMNFLTDFDVDVDMLGRKLVFYRAMGQCTSPHVALAPPIYAMPEIPGRIENRPIVTAVIRGQPFRAVLDTGSPQSLLFRNGAARLGLSLAMHSADARLKVRGIGPRSVDVVRHLSEPIEVGGITISALRFNISEEQDPSVDMILGMDFLGRVHLWISNATHQVVLQFPPAASPPIHPFGS